MPEASPPEAGQWPTGYRINEMPALLSDSLIASFADIPVAVAGDCMGRIIGAQGLRAYHNDVHRIMCGRALTVRVRPGDNLMIHKAFMMSRPGDIIVIDGGGDVSQALVGGLMRTTALTKKIGGFVLDAAIRDLAEWADGKMPVFAKGHTHRGPSKDGPGQINIPVACAGMVVHAGDLILGDADGVICIPADEVQALLPRVRAHLEKEAAIRLSNEKGSSDPERFDAVLRAKGLPI
ncbi:RraA family protein [Paralcaligenes sp. KSB-10]|jgi:regulator of RNase E activity RraA|uniref:RraA family protein n=1 Tax=Paralcaligenes sp. KSB-10 TaxID=2901142 RepID=UPI001E42ACBE|nr:RraA family protein [Paralcaligenes sp. KSB-10]UHL63747.1 RraA family protein [Paralcaligenes sp. KSB-10]